MGVLPRGRIVQQTTAHLVHIPAGRDGGFFGVHGGKGLGVVVITTAAIPPLGDWGKGTFLGPSESGKKIALIG